MGVQSPTEIKASGGWQRCADEEEISTYIYTVIGTFLVSIAVNFMFSGKVKTIDMVDALKGVE